MTTTLSKEELRKIALDGAILARSRDYSPCSCGFEGELTAMLTISEVVRLWKVKRYKVATAVRNGSILWRYAGKTKLISTLSVIRLWGYPKGL